MNIHAQERILQMMKKVQNISLEPAVGAIHADELEVLQKMATRNGWFAKVIAQLLNASQFDDTDSEAVDALQELSALVMKWALDLERQQNQQSLDLEPEEKVYVIIPNNRVKFLAVVQSDGRLYVPMLGQYFDVPEVQLLYKVPSAQKEVQVSTEFQNTLQNQLHRITQMATKKSKS